MKNAQKFSSFLPSFSVSFLRAGLLVLALFSVGAALSACGDDSTSKGPADLGLFITEDLNKVCVSTCTTDEQCANSCAAPASGSSCCDTATNTCFNASTNTCPAPLDFSVVGPY